MSGYWYWSAAVAVNPLTNQVYVSNSEPTVTMIDGNTNAATTVAGGSGPQKPAVAAGSNKIYVPNLNSNNVTVIDGATNGTITLTLPNAVGTAFAAVNEVTGRVYVSNSQSNTVTVIDGGPGSPPGPPGPPGPQGLQGPQGPAGPREPPALRDAKALLVHKEPLALRDRLARRAHKAQSRPKGLWDRPAAKLGTAMCRLPGSPRPSLAH